MSKAEEKARQLSKLYYNQGLDRAQIRDLSGAIDKLRFSLQLDKSNIQARNLLGLVYFETGEAVAALGQWIISSNLQPEDNLANDYIKDVQADQNRLKNISQSIRQYNEALAACRAGNDDMAAVSLRRVLTKNPKFIQAYHLLALIDIHEGKYASAQRILRRALKIDQTNPTTLRYLAEISEKTGNGRGLAGVRKVAEEPLETEKKSRAAAFRETPAFMNLVNIAFGLLIGTLLTSFVIVPVVRSRASERANKALVDYTTTIDTQDKQLSQQTTDIDSLNQNLTDTKTQLDNAKKAQEAYDKLLQAYASYQAGEYEQAGNALAEVDETLLSAEASDILNTIKGSITVEAHDIYVNEAGNSYYSGDYAKAAEYYERALESNPSDYGMLMLLAQCYTYLDQADKAIEVYNRIISYYPGGDEAANASYAISMLGGTPPETNVIVGQGEDDNVYVITDNDGDGVDDYVITDNDGDGIDDYQYAEGGYYETNG